MKKATIKSPPVARIALVQLMVLLVVVLALLPVDRVLCWSLLIGGVIQIGPQAYFTRQTFHYMGARQTPKIIRAIYRGETGKLLLTVVLFGLTFSYVSPVSLPGVFLGYGAMIIVQCFCAARVLSQSSN
ncbi:ATP synthase subunit I [Porticoccus sp.]|uniref:ATP synthase subunit I n=1 Tax=Porticoccus sp. TaxID=2024853 RepID=UPI002600543E|nr:ATP synthase subunit I [Porticoccus sp.]